MRFLINRVSQALDYYEDMQAPAERAFRLEGDNPVWAIDMFSLMDLMTLIDEEGKIIIDRSRHGVPKILIYDDYYE